ncbi:glycogen synthase, partial [Cystoisospora suis]
VHTGSVVPGVKLFFLHCASVFPHIYPDVYGLEQIRFISTFAKATLEIFCYLRQIPPLIVTNDWPTCLIPAYAKRKFFGNVFDSTIFYHLVHNLDPGYE